MTLAEYIDQEGGTVIAQRLGVSKQLVSHWRRGRQRISAERAVRLSQWPGAPTLAELRPDLMRAPDAAA